MSDLFWKFRLHFDVYNISAKQDFLMFYQPSFSNFQPYEVVSCSLQKLKLDKLVSKRLSLLVERCRGVNI